MLQTDVPVWLRFIDRYGQFFKSVYYSCLVGGPWLTPEQELDPMQIMWRANTAKRIDALAETENEVWIIEVADYPGMRSIGQLVTYRMLWLEDPKISKPEKMVLVLSRLDTDIAAAAFSIGILLYVLPD